MTEYMADFDDQTFIAIQELNFPGISQATYNGVNDCDCPRCARIRRIMKNFVTLENMDRASINDLDVEATRAQERGRKLFGEPVHVNTDEDRYGTSPGLLALRDLTAYNEEKRKEVEAMDKPNQRGAIVDGEALPVLSVDEAVEAFKRGENRVLVMAEDVDEFINRIQAAADAEEPEGDALTVDKLIRAKEFIDAQPDDLEPAWVDTWREIVDGFEKTTILGPYNGPRDPLEEADDAGRKAVPLASGVLDYFPDALVAVAAISHAGNEKHNPGQPMFWNRSKSGDEADALQRHFLARGTFDKHGNSHTAMMAWRALALLQKEIEDYRDDDTISRGSRA